MHQAGAPHAGLRGLEHSRGTPVQRHQLCSEGSSMLRRLSSQTSAGHKTAVQPGTAMGSSAWRKLIFLPKRKLLLIHKAFSIALAMSIDNSALLGIIFKKRCCLLWMRCNQQRPKAQPLAAVEGSLFQMKMPIYIVSTTQPYFSTSSHPGIPGPVFPYPLLFNSLSRYKNYFYQILLFPLDNLNYHYAKQTSYWFEF